MLSEIHIVCENKKMTSQKVNMYFSVGKLSLCAPGLQSGSYLQRKNLGLFTLCFNPTGSYTIPRWY